MSKKRNFDYLQADKGLQRGKNTKGNNHMLEAPEIVSWYIEIKSDYSVHIFTKRFFTRYVN